MRTFLPLFGSALVCLALLPHPAAAAPAATVPVCHVGDDGTTQTLNLPVKAATAHVAHGDPVNLTWYFDADGDGFGDASASLPACEALEGYVADDTDCDDGDAATFPGASELCDDADQDCDGEIDEESSDTTAWYLDADGDGFGGGSVVYACDAPSGATATSEDCDDGEAAVSPAGEETCGDGIDDDCDGEDLTCECPCWTYEDLDAVDRAEIAGYSALVTVAGIDAWLLLGFIDAYTTFFVGSDAASGETTYTCGEIVNATSGAASTVEEIDSGEHQACKDLFADWAGDNGPYLADCGLDPDGDGATGCVLDDAGELAMGDCDQTDASVFVDAAEVCGDAIDSDCDLTGDEADSDCTCPCWEDTAAVEALYVERGGLGGAYDLVGPDEDGFSTWVGVAATDESYNLWTNVDAAAGVYTCGEDRHLQDPFTSVSDSQEISATQFAACDDVLSAWGPTQLDDCNVDADGDGNNRCGVGDYYPWDNGPLLTDCDDSDPDVSIFGTEDCSDAIDNDCDGGTDAADSDCNCDVCWTEADLGAWAAASTSPALFGFPVAGPYGVPFGVTAWVDIATADAGTVNLVLTEDAGAGQYACVDAEGTTSLNVDQYGSCLDLLETWTSGLGSMGVDCGTDADGDGVTVCGSEDYGDTTLPDCHDGDAAISPFAVEDCTDGLDNDCDGDTDDTDSACGCPCDDVAAYMNATGTTTYAQAYSGTCTDDACSCFVFDTADWSAPAYTESITAVQYEVCSTP